MKNVLPSLIFIFIFTSFCYSANDDFLTISTDIKPKRIKQGEEGIIKIKIIPKIGLKISSHPEFMIKFDNNTNLVFSKVFFTASELDFQTMQENDLVFIDLEKEISIPFKVKENSLIGKHIISGEVIFTAVFEDNWSLKTFQKFYIDFISKRNYKLNRK